jgi:hypothetical protein
MIHEQHMGENGQAHDSMASSFAQSRDCCRSTAQNLAMCFPFAFVSAESRAICLGIQQHFMTKAGARDVIGSIRVNATEREKKYRVQR